MTVAAGPVLAADGTPLKRSLNRALRAQKLRALALIAPLLIFILVTFVFPIADMLFRSVENQIVSETIPRTVLALEDWEDRSELPGEEVYAAMALDLMIAAENRVHTRLGSRLNYEAAGLSSLFRRSGRGVDDIGEHYADQFIDFDEVWEDPEAWVRLMATPAWAEAALTDGAIAEALPRFQLATGIADALPETAEAYEGFARTVIAVDEDNPAEEEPWNVVYLALYRDLAGGASHEQLPGLAPRRRGGLSR